MKKRVIALLLVTHLGIGVLGFGLGIYALPILIAPPAPTDAELLTRNSNATYQAEFRKDLAGSDGLHWGEGTVSIGKDFISLMGSLAPGPDYKLYLSPTYVETEADFNREKVNMVQVADVKTFDNFSVTVPTTIDPSQYTTVIIWCETFGEFITAARYR